MGRRSDPERVFEAQKAGVRNRLIGNGMQPETADRWLDAWVLEATGLELPKDGAYWQAGWDWIAENGRRADRPVIGRTQRGTRQAPHRLTTGRGRRR